MSIKPRAPYILVKPIGESQTAGGLFIPSSDDDRKALGTAEVVAVSTGYEGEPIIPGQRVYLAPNAGHKVVNDGEQFILVKDSDVLGVIQS